MAQTPLDPETDAALSALRETATTLQAQVTSRYLKDQIAYAIRDLMKR